MVINDCGIPDVLKAQTLIRKKNKKKRKRGKEKKKKLLKQVYMEKPQRKSRFNKNQVIPIAFDIKKKKKTKFIVEHPSITSGTFQNKHDGKNSLHT